TTKATQTSIATSAGKEVVGAPHGIRENSGSSLPRCPEPTVSGRTRRFFVRAGHFQTSRPAHHGFMQRLFPGLAAAGRRPVIPARGSEARCAAPNARPGVYAPRDDGRTTLRYWRGQPQPSRRSLPRFELGQESVAEIIAGFGPDPRPPSVWGC